MTSKIKPDKAVCIIWTTDFSCVAAAGLWSLIKNGVTYYLFFRTLFAFFDCSKPGIAVFLENTVMLFLFVFAGANTVRIIKVTDNGREKKKLRNYYQGRRLMYADTDNTRRKSVTAARL